MRPPLLAVPLLLWSASGLAQGDVCQRTAAAEVIAADGTFLGWIAPPGHADSIFNPQGRYGSAAQAGSLWSPSGRYGARAGAASALFDGATMPPRIMRNGVRVGFLTANRHLVGAIDPVALGMACYAVRAGG